MKVRVPRKHNKRRRLWGILVTPEPVDVLVLEPTTNHHDSETMTTELSGTARFVITTV